MLKLLKKFKVLIIVLIAAGAYYAWMNPYAVPSPVVTQKLVQYKEQGINPEDIRELKLETPGFVLGIQDKVSSFSKNTTIPTSLSGMPEEVVVEDVVSQLTQNIKDLPEKQVEKVKIQFCQDVLRQATASGATQP